MTDWKFTKRGNACAGCQRAFSEGEAHVSSLAVEGEGIARVDSCLACWKAHDASAALFWWRTRHSENKPRGLALNLEALEGLFVSLESRVETSLRELRYVLCLILMRKRRLKIERVARTESGEALVVSRPRRRETTFEVDVFDFSPEQVDELRGRLQDVFEQADVDAPTEDRGEGEGAQDGGSAAGAESGAGVGANPGSGSGSGSGAGAGANSGA